jgi:hypothetical protein
MERIAAVGGEPANPLAITFNRKVKGLAVKGYHVDFEKTLTVGKLVETLGKAMDMPHESFFLLWEGKRLDDAQTISGNDVLEPSAAAKRRGAKLNIACAFEDKAMTNAASEESQRKADEEYARQIREAEKIAAETARMKEVNRKNEECERRGGVMVNEVVFSKIDFKCGESMKVCKGEKGIVEGPSEMDDCVHVKFPNMHADLLPSQFDNSITHQFKVIYAGAFHRPMKTSEVDSLQVNLSVQGCGGCGRVQVSCFALSGEAMQSVDLTNNAQIYALDNLLHELGWSAMDVFDEGGHKLKSDMFLRDYAWLLLKKNPLPHNSFISVDDLTLVQIEALLEAMKAEVTEGGLRKLQQLNDVVYPNVTLVHLAKFFGWHGSLSEKSIGSEAWSKFSWNSQGDYALVFDAWIEFVHRIEERRHRNF